MIFFHERLVKLSFAWAPNDETWDNWSEATEKAHLQEYQQELDAQLAGKDALLWGRASVVLDNRSGGTDIWIDYSQP